MQDISNAPRGSRLRIAMWTLAAVPLVAPAVAMQLTTEVDWSPLDFAFAAILIGGTGGLIELAVRRSRNLAYRAASVLTAAGILLLTWINGAVGIIGPDGEQANLLFLGVAAIAAIGAVLARLRPAPMARVMIVTAMAQAAAPVVAGMVWPSIGSIYSGREVVLYGGFVAVWAAAARLYRRAARTGRGDEGLFDPNSSSTAKISRTTRSRIASRGSFVRRSRWPAAPVSPISRSARMRAVAASSPQCSAMARPK